MSDTVRSPRPRSRHARRLALAAVLVAGVGAVRAVSPPGGHGQPLDTPRRILEGELPSRPPVSFSPGTDTSLCMSWEPTIAVDPNNQKVVAVSQFLSIQVSFDGGDTFPVTVTAPGVSPAGDPSLAFDSQGRLFITYLGRPGPGRDVLITGYDVDAGAGTVTQMAGTAAVNVAAAAGIGGNNADKEWLAADSNASSAFADRLYCAWIRLDTPNFSVWTSFSTDQGQTWSAAQQLSAADEGTCWPTHVAVGPDGDAYVAWHGQTGFLDPSGNDVPNGTSGRIVLRRSDNGGVAWQPRSFPFPAGQADMTYDVQHEANGAIPGANMWLFGSVQPWILPDPIVAGRVFVVANDDPDNDVDSGDAANVYITTSSDSGDTWAPRNRVDQGPAGTFQIMPTAAINPNNGTIGVAYFDNRAGADANADGFFELDVMATYSTNAGVSWSPEVDVNDGRMDPNRATTCRFCGSDAVTNQPCGTGACPGPGTTRIGEYFGVAYGECTLHFAWPDNATCSGDFDTFYDRDPELGGDVAAPTLNCPPDAVVACGAPTDPPATGTATASDDCDLDPVVDYSDALLPGNCPPGSIIRTIRRTWTATDAAGNVASCTQDIVETDMAPPTLFVPPPIVTECTSPGGVLATDLVIVAWLSGASASDDCSTPTVTNDAPALFPFGCLPGGNVTIVTFTAIDACGKTTVAASTVTVVDTTPPTLSCSVTTHVLWPPNHSFVDVGLVVTTADSCDPASPTISIGVTSDESAGDALGAGGPVHCPDAIVTADGHVLLRAERSGGGDGRVYGIAVTATDSCGNATACAAQVSVPKSQGHHGAAVDSGQSFDATDCD